MSRTQRVDSARRVFMHVGQRMRDVDVEASSTDVFPANKQGAELGPNILDLCLEMMLGYVRYYFLSLYHIGIFLW